MDGTGVGAHMFIKPCGFYPCLLGIKARNKFSAVNLDDSEFLDTYSSLISEKKKPRQTNIDSSFIQNTIQTSLEIHFRSSSFDNT